MKYKVGDKVRIKSLDWYKENTNECGYIMCGCVPFNTNMSIYCGKVLTICDAKEEFSYYQMKECKYVFTDEMIEGLAEEEIIDLTSIVMETVEEKTIQNALTYGYNLPEGYQFVDENGNIINATKIVLEKKKREYPKTFDKCCHILQTAFVCDVRLHKGKYYDIFRALAKLIVCRDAYWKIAGEEMGLSGSWKPDFASCKIKYAITYYNNAVSRYSEVDYNSTILVFPTEEMRDAFYENFKKEIEQCKELL